MKTYKYFFYLLFILLPVIASGQCVTGFASDAGVLGLNNTSVWTQENNVLGAPDGDVAQILGFTPLDPGESTSVLSSWDFGVTVPCNATIDNVAFLVTRRNNEIAGSVVDETINLRFGNFFPSPVNAAVATPWENNTLGFETFRYDPPGGWGVTLTPELINDLRLGLLMTVENTSATSVGMPQIDAIEIEVCYTVNGSEQPPLTAVVNTLSDNLCDPLGTGGIEIVATGGSGMYEYSIDNGITYQSSNIFPDLSSQTYSVRVRNTDMSCSTNIGNRYVGCNDGPLLQVGDAIYSCQPNGGNSVTLAIDRIQPLNDLYNAGQFFQDVSPQLQGQAFTWTTLELGGPVYAVALDENNNIYTGVSSLFNLIVPVTSADLIAIDGVTGVPTVIASLPGTTGVGQIEYDQNCSQLFAANMEDGTIYRYSTTGTLLSSYDPLMPDDGVPGLAPIGEVIAGMALNPADNRLYYSVWANDLSDTGQRNVIRSIEIDPVTCDFVPGTDILEVTMPFISELESGGIEATQNYSMPVFDIEFNDAGTIMLLAESGYDYDFPRTVAHQSRLLRYDGSTTAWGLVNNPPAGNASFQYEIGGLADGKNSLGGVDFGYAGIDGGGCVADDESFVVSIGDALTGANCSVTGCLYGIQYLPVEGGRPENSVLVDLARAPTSQQKGFFGDVDVVSGCCPCACPTITPTLTPASTDLCAGDMITVCASSITGGTGPYTYLWDTAETTDCIDVSPLATTTYSVTVTDAMLCTGEGDIEVTVAPALSLDNVAATDDTSCQADNGAITITATGGEAPLTFSIDGGTTFQVSNMFANLSAGNYDIVVEDDFGCTVSGMTTLVFTNSLMITNVSAVDNTSCATANGSVTITASGGTAPLSYSIDGGLTFNSSNIFTGVGEGALDIVVEGALGCTATTMVMISGPDLPVIDDIVTTADTDCLIDNGTITLTASGGTAPLMYSIDGGLTFNASNVFTGLAEGSFGILVEDAFGCTASSSVTLTGPMLLTIDDIDTTDDTDCEIDNGTIEITASGGTAPFSYSIDGGLTFNSNNLFTGLVSGSYDIVVQDANGCSDTEFETLDGPMSFSATYVVTNDSDCDRDNGSITVTTSGGAAPFMYSVDGGLSFGTANVIPNLAAGLYSVVVRGADNCTDMSTQEVLGPDPLVYSSSVTNPSCGAPGNISINLTGGTAPYSYSVDGGVTFQASNVFSNLGSGSFDIVVTDSQSCTTGETVTLTEPVCGGGVGNFVWVDMNGNGTQDPGEPGVPDVRVELYNQLGNLVRIQFTDNNGMYFFDNVPDGDYYVSFVTPDGFTSTSANRSGNSETDSDVDDSNGEGSTAVFTLSAGEIDLSIDYGIFECIPVGELVWFDVDEDGIADNEENGINGLEVELFRNIANRWIMVESQFTGHKPGTASDDGFYKFCVPPGDYYLKFNNPPNRIVRTQPNRGSDSTRDSDITDSFGTGTTNAFTVLSGDERCDIGAGFVPAGSIGDFVWLDVNLNGLRDAEEQGIEGIMVQAINGDGEMAAFDVTNDEGRYFLDLLPEDDYYVQFLLPEDFSLTLSNEGSDEELDSDVDDSNGPNTTATFRVNPGEHVDGIDAGVLNAGLPVTWLSVDGDARTDYNYIEWRVASEINVDFYELQHTSDLNSEFEGVGTKRSEFGTYQGELHYNLRHDNVEEKINYYRIKQFDFDGRFDYSKIISINNVEGSSSAQPQIAVYPNPATDALNIGIEMPSSAGEIQINLHDNLGRKVASNLVYDIDIEQGYKGYNVDVTNITQGIYTLEIIIDKLVVVKKVAITK